MTRFWASVFALFFVTAAHAGTVHSQTGAFATVADNSVASFQCLINQLELQRYPIKDMRGCGKGSVKGSLHPTCRALDINQKRRNVTVPRMPSNEIALAKVCGLVAGAQWPRRPDSGHFQYGGWDGTQVKHRRMYVKTDKPHGFFDWLFGSKK